MTRKFYFLFTLLLLAVCGNTFADSFTIAFTAGTKTATAIQTSRRTRQTLWSAVQMLTQKLCCQTIHDCPKVVPLHYESE